MREQKGLHRILSRGLLGFISDNVVYGIDATANIIGSRTITRVNT